MRYQVVLELIGLTRVQNVNLALFTNTSSVVTKLCLQNAFSFLKLLTVLLLSLKMVGIKVIASIVRRVS